MNQAIAFDTLRYAKILAEHGVENSEVHVKLLAEIIPQNIYLKYEVDAMLEAVIKRSDEKFFKLQKEMMALENRSDRKIEQIINQTVRRMTVVFGIMTGFLTAVNLILHFFH